MADKTAIAWTDATWNPITGCSVVSPGCTNCYAMRLAGTRLRHHPSRKGLTQQTKAGPVWTGEVRLNDQWLDMPLRWKRPRMIFVCAHGDLFHENVPLHWIGKIWEIMSQAHRKNGHIFQILTKRPERMREALGPRGIGWYATEDIVPCPEPGIWLGTSIEDGKREARSWHLANTSAAIRFWSIEPLLEDLGDLTRFCLFDTIDGDRKAVDWVIVGGESGPRARPMDPAWARSIRDQCKAAGVAFFMKQMARKAPIPEDLQIREFPHG